MYNRYIPQPDGTYRRRTVPDQKPAPPPPIPRCSPEPPPPEPPKPPIPPPRRPPCPRQHPPRPIPQSKSNDTSAAGFLRRLLPKDFDTGDLMIVLLLLLMAGDCQEEQNTALLTLALYFFM